MTAIPNTGSTMHPSMVISYSTTDLAKAAVLPVKAMHVMLTWADALPGERWERRELVAAAALGRVYRDLQAFGMVPSQGLVRRVWNQSLSAMAAARGFVSIGLGTFSICIDIRGIDQWLRESGYP